MKKPIRERLERWIDNSTDPTNQLGQNPKALPAPPEDSHTARPVKRLELSELWLFRRVYPVVAVVLGLAIVSVLMLTVFSLPRFGGDEVPANNEVAHRYIADGPEETGAVNMVAGMILDYRAFDTLGESHVLFTGVCAVHPPAGGCGAPAPEPQEAAEAARRGAEAAARPDAGPHPAPGGADSGAGNLRLRHLRGAQRAPLPGRRLLGRRDSGRGADSLLRGLRLRADRAVHEPPDVPGGDLLRAGVLLAGQVLELLHRGQRPRERHQHGHAGQYLLGGPDYAAGHRRGRRGRLHHVWSLQSVSEGEESDESCAGSPAGGCGGAALRHWLYAAAPAPQPH